MNTGVACRNCLVGLASLASCVLQGCASGAAAGSQTESAASARGEALAGRACGVCHGMGSDGQSSFPNAPAFRDMRIDYNAISYERRMAQLHVGRVGMPPASISLAEVADVVAYVRRLQFSTAPSRADQRD